MKKVEKNIAKEKYVSYNVHKSRLNTQNSTKEGEKNMQKEKLNQKNKGITLIALIITLIIMLLLVTVTTTVSLNGGLFNTAKGATEKTLLEKEKEQLTEVTMGAMGEDAIVDFEKLEQVLPDVFVKTGEKTYKSTQSGQTYLINDKGTISITEENDLEYGTIRNKTKNITYSSIVEAINNSDDNDIIEIASGEYDLVGDAELLTGGALLDINKSITIKGTNPNNKPVLLVATSDGTTINSIIDGMEIKADNVTIENIILKVSDGISGSGNIIKIPYKDSTNFYSGITITNCEFYGSDHTVEMYGNNVNINNCILDESTAVDQGNILVIRGTTGNLNINNNVFKGNSQRKHGISFYSGTNSYIEGNILIENNTFDSVYKPIVHESSMTYNNVSVEVKNNIFTNYKKKAVAIDNGNYITYNVTGNIFDIPSDGTVIIDNGVNFTVNADNNYWGTATPDKSLLFEGNVNATTYYTSEDKANVANW